MNALLSRRSFLKVSSSSLGGVLIWANIPGPGVAGERIGAKPVDINVFIQVEKNGKVIIGARGCEMGQGVKTSLPMLIAEELDVPWSMVEVRQLPYRLLHSKNTKEITYKYGNQNTDASKSIRRAWDELRQAGAQARHLFIEAAAIRWRSDPENLGTHEASVRHPDGRVLTYAELAEEASLLDPPNSVLTLKSERKFNIVGTAVPTVDAHEIVTGQTTYGSDFEIPGSLIAMIVRCPYFEGKVKKFDAGEALKIEGVRDIIEIPAPDPKEKEVRNTAAGIAVIADDTWSAIKACRALKVDWQKGTWAGDSTRALEERARRAVSGSEAIVPRRDGDLEIARKSASQVVKASYYMPFLAHCTMEPMHANLDLRKDRALLIASLQIPDRASQLIHAMTGIDRTNIDIRLPRLGGGFGRRIGADYVGEAVYIARAINRPVKLIWSREDDFQNDLYRPAGLHSMTAFLDKNQQLSGWSHRVAATKRIFREPGLTGIGVNEWVGNLDPDAIPAGCVANYEASYVPLEFGLRRGWWRGPLPTFVAFANQSFIDEVAHAAGADPLAFQLALLGRARKLDYRDMNFEDNRSPTKLDTGRLARVLKRAAENITYGRRLNSGHGIGLAAHFIYGAYTAHAMEVSYAREKLKIERCVCVTDVGKVVNPLGVEGQMMSGTIDGISTALFAEISVEQGKVQQSNFSDYPLLRMKQAPDVEVEILNSNEPPMGAGEMGIPTAAPALTNAIFAATGKRIRRLPVAGQLRQQA